MKSTIIKYACRCQSAIFTLTSAIALLASSSSVLSYDTPVGGGFTKGYLVGEYFPNATLSGNPSFNRYDLRIDHDWKTNLEVGGSLAPSYRDFPTDNFSVRWTGELIARFTESYTISALADEGVRVWIKPQTQGTWGTALIDNWTSHPASAVTDTANISLTKDQKYDIKVEYRDLTGAACAHLRWSSPSTPLEVIDTVTQMGLNHSTYTGVVHANISRFLNGDTYNPYSTGYPAVNEPLTFDASGWPTSNFTFIGNGNSVPSLPGTYTLRFKGRARVQIGGATFAATSNNTLPNGTGYDAATNLTTATFTFSNPEFKDRVNAKFNETQRTATSALGTGITDLYVMEPIAKDSTIPHEVGRVMAQDAIEAFKHFRLIRWQTTGLDAEYVTTWSDRTLPTASAFESNNDANGTMGSQNLETIIMFSNESGRDLHLSIPTLSDYDYFLNLARLIKYGSDGVNPYTSHVANPVYPPLNPGIRVYLEHGNEQGWSAIKGEEPNFTDYMTTSEGQILNYDGAAPNGNIFRWHALRTVRISQKFREVFGDEMMSRVRPCLFGQYSQIWQTQMCQFIDSYFNNGKGNNVQDPHPVDYYLWGAGAAVYYTCTNKYGTFSTEPLTNWELESYSINAGAASLRPTGGSWNFTGNAGVLDARISRRSALASVNLSGLTPSNSLAADTYVGFKFTVGTKDIYVYEIGRQVISGNNKAHQLAIVDSTGKNLVSGINAVDTTAFTAGQMGYRNHQISSWTTSNSRTQAPLRLLAGQTYYCVSKELKASDTYYASAVPVSADSAITVNGAVTSTDAKSFTTTAGSLTFGPVNFRFADTPISTSSGNIGFPPDVTGSVEPREIALGDQRAFIVGTGSIAQTVSAPIADQYAVFFTCAQSPVKSNALTITINGVNVWDNDVPSASRKPAAGLYPYLTGVTTLASGQSVEIKIQGMTDDSTAVCYLDNIRLVSLGNFYGDANASTFPFTGEATGADNSGSFRKIARSVAGMAHNWGLTPLTYEGGWAFGGDWEVGDMLMWDYAKKLDSRTIAADNNAFNIWREYGGTVFDHYYRAFEENELHTMESLPLVQAAMARNRTITEASFGATPSGPLPFGNESHYRGDNLGEYSSYLDIDHNSINTDKSVPTGRWLSWVLYAPVSGEYRFILDTSSGGTYRTTLDGDSNIKASGTSGTPVLFTAFLTKGQHHVKVLGVSGTFTLNSLQFNAPGYFSAPTTLTATGETTISGRVSLDWADSIEPNVIGYHVYRSSSASPNYVQLTLNPLAVSEFTDKDVDNGVTYSYYVKVVSANGSLSEPSAVVSATPIEYIPGTLLTDDFSDGTLAPWTPLLSPASFRVSGGSLEIFQNTNALAYLDNATVNSLGDYKVKLRFKANDNDEFGVLVRYNPDTRTGYRFVMNRQSGYRRLQAVTYNTSYSATTTNLASSTHTSAADSVTTSGSEYAHNLNQWYQLEIRLVGNTIQVILDGNTLFGGAVSDTSGANYANGTIGFLGSYCSGVMLDDLQIISDEVETETVPAAPSAFSASSISPSTLRLSFTDNADNEEGFDIDTRVSGTSQWIFLDPEAAITGTGTTIAVDVEGLEEDTMYDFRIRAYNGIGESEWVSTSGATEPEYQGFTQTSAGLLVMEAENATQVVAGTGSSANPSWSQVADAAASGSSSMGTTNTPNSWTVFNTTDASVLKFDATFVSTGNHYLWVRTRCLTAGGGDDSINHTLDGSALVRLDTTNSTDWTWKKAPAAINITTTGLHALRIYVRENGAQIDKVVLTTNASFATPIGAGPDETH